MSLSDIVSNLDLKIYPIIGMILFLSAFGVIVWRALRAPKGLSHYESMLPLEDGLTDLAMDPNGKGESRG